VTEVRVSNPAIRMAAATLVPAATDREVPLTVSVIACVPLCGCSGMRRAPHEPLGQIGLDWDLCLFANEVVRQQLCGSQRSCDAKPLVPSRQKQRTVFGPGANQR